MSISRKDWSALSSLTRQWTVEDEEEVERERRRKIRSHSSTADSDDDHADDLTPTTVSSTQDSQEPVDQSQVDFIEMLRARDERRRRRHQEMLRHQDLQDGQDGAARGTSEGARGAGEMLRQQGPQEDGQDGAARGTSEGARGAGEMLRQQSPQEDGQDGAVRGTSEGARGAGEMLKVGLSQETPPVGTSNSVKNQFPESEQRAEPGPATKSSRKFVSSLSISFDKSSSSFSGGGSLSSPLSPTGSFRAASPDQPSGVFGQNGDEQGYRNESPTKQVTSPKESEQVPFRRQNYRAWSFRVIKKKEDQSLPLQRSASVRISSDNTEATKAPNHREHKQSPFQRNSKQRVSSRSIQETMEKLALAAQKSENVRSPTVLQKSLYSLDEVCKKRELFEKERLERAGPEGCHQPLYNATIASRRQLWEKRTEEASNPSSRPHSARNPQF